jgi:hypothetical protein
MKIHTVIFLFLPLLLEVQAIIPSENAITKKNGNTMAVPENKTTPIHYGPYSIVIDEIMADPDPPVNLPVAEYVELLNASEMAVTAVGWKLAVGDKQIKLPPFQLGVKCYLIVCDIDDSLLLKQYGAILPVDALPALKNEGQTLALLDSANDIIHSVSYSERWYGNTLKSEGGWSLEMIDPENPCGQQENWTASDNYLGGTPGTMNSVNRDNPDVSRPVLLRAATTCDTGLLVSFSEPLQISSASDPFKYSVDHNVFHPKAAKPLPPDFSSVLLTFQEEFRESYTYELMVLNSVCDCAGNRLADSYTEFGIASLPDSFDLVINEVLFDAREDDEFIEIYNRSERITDLSSLALALMDERTGTCTRKIYECKGNFQLLPGQYAVITGNAANLQKNYDCKVPAAIIEADKALNLPDDRGAIALLRNLTRQIDCFSYSAAYHFEMIRNPEGISLERLISDKPTNDPDNWHSAAEDAGFATPGYKNSQAFPLAEIPSPTVWTEPEVFTPDNDGIDDFLVISYHLDNPGSLANILVFDSRGRLVRKLANNIWLGAEGFFTWDGTNAEGNLEKAGMFIVYAEILSQNGTVKKYTNTCVLSKVLK